MSDEAAEQLKTSRESCPARMVAHGFDNLAQPGDFYYDGPRMVIWLPGLTRWAGTIAIKVQEDPATKGPVWSFSGSRECPTLSPSIRTCVQKDPAKEEQVELWHGYMQQGVLRSC